MPNPHTVAQLQSAQQMIQAGNLAGFCMHQEKKTNKKRTVCLINIFSVTIFFGRSSAPRITVDYSSLGRTRLDSELMSHRQTMAWSSS